MGLSKKSKTRLRWMMALGLLALFVLFTFLPPYDRQAYLAWVEAWPPDQSGQIRSGVGGERLESLYLGSSFQTLPKELALELGLVRGDLFNPGTGCFHNAYGSRDIRIECMKEFWPVTAEPESEKWIIGFTLLTPRFATPQGVRLGDREETVWARYPRAQWTEDGRIQAGDFDYKLYFTIKNGVVTSIEGRTPYS